MKTFLRTLLLAVLAAASGTAGNAAAKDIQATQPSVIGLYFHAHWCTNCKTLDPKLEASLDKLTKAPFLLVELDVSNESTQYQAGMTAAALGLAKTFDENNPKTGFILLIDPKNGSTLGRITKDSTPDEIVTTIESAIAQAAQS